MLVNKPWKFCQTLEIVPVLQGNTGCFKSADAPVGILNTEVFLFFQLFYFTTMVVIIRSPVKFNLVEKQPDAENIFCRDCPLVTYRVAV